MTEHDLNTKKKIRPQDRWNEAHGLFPRTYKLQKEIADGFKAACEKAGTSQKAQLERMMKEFIASVNPD